MDLDTAGARYTIIKSMLSYAHNLCSGLLPCMAKSQKWPAISLLSFPFCLLLTMAKSKNWEFVVVRAE